MHRRYFLTTLTLMIYTLIVFMVRHVQENSEDILTSSVITHEVKHDSTWSHDQENHDSSSRVSDISEPLPVKGRKRIAFFHPYHTGLKSHMQRLNMTLCKYKCEVDFAGNRVGVANAHAVLFQGNHMPPMVPKRLSSDQVFVFINVEAPQYLHYTNLALPRWRHFFNWTMTYRLDSDIPYPYGTIVLNPSHHDEVLSNLTSETNKVMGNIGRLQMNKVNTALQNTVVSGIPEKPYRTTFRRKSKGAAWLVSHCSTASQRERYVHAMKRQLQIDIFGHCSKRSCKKGSEECRQGVIRDYYFYLSFENSLCKDYVTEKEFNWFNEDIITVVRGARTYQNHLPFGTYIDADDFKSPQELAKFLNELTKDEDRYITYLRRKDNFIAVNSQMLVQNAYCELCKRLHHLDKYRKSVKDIRMWWTRDKCTQPTDIYGLKKT